MYLPNGNECSLNFAGQTHSIKAIKSNRDKKLIAVATTKNIFIWLSSPHLLLCSSDEYVSHGEFENLLWNNDSSAIAVMTNTNKILIYSIDINIDDYCYNFVDSQDPYFQRNSHELFIKAPRPVVKIKPSIVINLADVPSSCITTSNEMVVCVKNGFTHHILWNGDIQPEKSFNISSVPFSMDQMHSKSELISDPTTIISEMVYAPLLGGFNIILSDGRGALLTSTNPQFGPKTVLGVWASGLTDAVCCDVNHKYLLLLFGCKNGDVCAYNIDDLNGSLIQAFRVCPRVTNGPDLTHRIGPVHKICAQSSGQAFAAIWKPCSENALPKVYAIFTPFGAQTFCNLEGVIDDSNNFSQYNAIEWGPEGYQLWLGTDEGLSVQSIVRSASCGSPIMEHVERAVLVSDSMVMIGAAKERETDATAPHSVWEHISITHEYISSNWPIKFASTDREFKNLVVAGQRGFAHYSLVTRRWKIFGNESQEKSLIISGGIFFWNDFIVAAAMNADNQKSYLYFYPLSQRLDNSYSSSFQLEECPTLVSLRGDVCVILDIASEISLIKLNSHSNRRDNYPKASCEIVSVIRIQDLIPHPGCVVSLQLTTLNLDVRGKLPPAFYSNIDTVIVNIAGRLITLSVSGEDGKLNQPMVIASYVEKMWHDRTLANSTQALHSTEFEEFSKGHRRNVSNISTPTTSSSNESCSPSRRSTAVHLSNALWIACGARGIKVWLPLIPGKKSTTTQDMTFIAKRIMLPFELDIYPIVICASDCLAIGVESQFHHVSKFAKENSKSKNITVFGLHRNSEVFVHHLLKQLLKRNLGVFALEVASSCRCLPHFSHALELLLHEILEEEATSSEPIPDPLLPRCVAFIHEFPEFLKTVAHCARKTELALWSALFDVTGSPNALFEECLQKGELENAASYVIVLQNFESTETSIEQASRLVREALLSKKWSIAREMIRFANSIGVEDIDSVSPPPSAKTSLSRRPTTSSPNEQQSNEFVIGRFQAGGASRLGKVRHSVSVDTKETPGRKDSCSSKHSLTRALSNDMSPTTTSNKMAIRMNSILEEHFWHLLNNYMIRDLGFFLAELNFDISSMLEVRRKQLQQSPKPSNVNCYLVEDFALALTRLHSQFKYPFPVVGSHFVHQIEKKLGALRTSQSTASLNGFVKDEEANEKIIELEKTKKSYVSDKKSVGNDEEEEGSEIVIQEEKLERITGENGKIQRTTSIVSTNLTAMTPSSDESRSIAGDWQRTDYLVGEKTAKGNEESCRQISFMLDLFAKSAVVDWVFLLCLLSRDERRLRQEVTVELVGRCGVNNFAKIRFACTELVKWAVEKCSGYVALLQLFNAHLNLVAEQAGVGEIKYVPTATKEAKSTQQEKRERTGREVLMDSKLKMSFPHRRERSRSADRVSKGVKRYDDVICAEDGAENLNDDGCSIM